MINAVKHQNLKVNNAKSREQSTQHSTWIKSNRNTKISKYLSIITLNVNELNSLIKRHRLSDWI
jgi:hypothetical protein